MVIMYTIDIPEGIKVEESGNTLKITGKLGSNERQFNESLMNVKLEKNQIVIEKTNFKKLDKKASIAIKTFMSEIRNDIKGVNEYYETKMEAVFAHFPMTLEISGKKLIIKNMLGERTARESRIIGDSKVEIKDKTLKIYGTKLDDVMQTAANFRTTTKVKNKDERVFQDGIYFSIE
ncbi:50S ribosomal protein L6p [Candidatus Mancarchaeum acidiphilum]|uniref:50S ribosomal protein L6 n=2 Tax=Candidatus Mancarchaeum acidiphilum TaxID=1920749 RepID=A0A218NLS7_9ARCH|nr:50S ribosomal protein L6p [Candidatus Mancarchaeum acidiphilum]